jgi:hypothetical protein
MQAKNEASAVKIKGVDYKAGKLDRGVDLHWFV